MQKLAQRLERLGTETAFSVAQAAAAWKAKGNLVYPFHLGDINIPTASNIVEATAGVDCFAALGTAALRRSPPG
jgi:aspartate aminotransferase